MSILFFGMERKRACDLRSTFSYETSHNVLFRAVYTVYMTLFVGEYCLSDGVSCCYVMQFSQFMKEEGERKHLWSYSSFSTPFESDFD